MGKITADVVVKKYVENRDKLAADAKAFVESQKPIKEEQEKLEQWMSATLSKVGADNIKTEHGTIMKTLTTSVKVADFDNILAFVFQPVADALRLYVTPDHIPEILAKMRVDFLNKAVNKTAVQEWMEQGNDIPPGVNVEWHTSIGVRRA